VSVPGTEHQAPTCYTHLVPVPRVMSKQAFKAQVLLVREELLDVQQQLRQAPFPVLLLFSGVEAAGKSETMNLLHEWMDPRWLHTHAYGAPSDEERERPDHWRFWRDLPPKGQIGILMNAWYAGPIDQRAHGHIDQTQFRRELARIARLEQLLTDDGALVLKFMMQLDRETQQARLKALERDPLTRWRVTAEQWRQARLYDRIVAAEAAAVALTDASQAPWIVVDGRDERQRSLMVARMIRDRVGRRLDELALARPPRRVNAVAPVLRRAPPSAPARAGSTKLKSLDMSRTAEKGRYETGLAQAQGRLNLLQRKARRKGISTIAVFEGWDAAGKGGAIRRITAALDAREYKVIPVAAPTDEERAQHYLWRFWRHLSRAGRISIFDRSWYGRVLVERVEGFAREDEWRRAYAEINDFERALVDHGVVIVKFWVHITKDEQLRRFEERERLAHKRWKLTDEDWRNRKRWKAYERAVDEMVARTSLPAAPWTLVEGNDKNYARLKILRAMADRLARAVEG
jgi:polyphosphate:AMP phosphotransferase